MLTTIFKKKKLPVDAQFVCAVLDLPSFHNIMAINATTFCFLWEPFLTVI